MVLIHRESEAGSPVSKILEVRLIRFVATGVFNTLVGYGFFSVPVLVTVNPTAVVIIGTLGGIAFNFFSYGGLVFKNAYLGNLKRFVLATQRS